MWKGKSAISQVMCQCFAVIFLFFCCEFNDLCILFCICIWFTAGDKTAKEFPCPQVPANVLKDIVKYLQHHNGKKPEEIPCPVRSVNMAQIVNDPWDAEYIDGFEKKEIFEIILVCHSFLLFYIYFAFFLVRVLHSP